MSFFFNPMILLQTWSHLATQEKAKQRYLYNQEKEAHQHSTNQTPAPTQRTQPYICKNPPFYLIKEATPKPTPHSPLLQGLLTCFPEARDTILSNLFKEYSAEKLPITVTGIPKKNNTNKQTICNPVTFTAIKVQLSNLIKSFLKSIKDSQPELYKRLNELPQTSFLFSDELKNLKNQTVTLIKKHFRTPDLHKPLKFTITAQELINLLRRKTEKLLTTPV